MSSYLPKRGILFILGLFFLVLTSPVSAADHDHDHEGGGTVWICSMHPQIQLPEFGQCPICFMDLIEVLKDDGAGKRHSLRQVSLDDRARKMARVAVVPVVRGVEGVETRMVGKVNYDETRVATITARVAGRIDALHVDYTGALVTKGQAMADIYSPELLAGQTELLQAVASVRQYGNSISSLLKSTVLRTEQAARDKLRLLGMTPEQIDALISRGHPLDHVTLQAPLGGVVIRKAVVEGMYVATGSQIYTIADLDRLWVELEAYESDLQGIRLGQQVTFRAEALKGRFFEGQVAFVDPVVNEKTRTIRVRLNVVNREGLLKPGMFVRALAHGPDPGQTSNPPLLIPVSAPLITGKRALVYVQLADEEGVYVGKEIILGPRRGDFYEVVSGLDEGELVVTAGNFRIDSAVQLQARPSMMNPFLAGGGGKQEELTPLFTSKVRALAKVFDLLTASVHQGDEAEIAALLIAFQERLRALAAEELADQERVVWQELAMLLNSDLILLQEVESRNERDRLYGAMTEHFHKLRRYYGLPLGGDFHGTGSPAARQALGRLVTAYFQLQQGLAADDLPMARQAVGGVAAVLEPVISHLDASLAREMSRVAEALSPAADLEELRTTLYPLSQVLARAVAALGVSGAGSVYEQFCPMAFDNSGATWLAENEEINNPYFGAMMLRCGEVQRQLHDEL